MATKRSNTSPDKTTPRSAKTGTSRQIRSTITDEAVEISHRTLKDHQGRVFREIVSAGETVLVTNRERVDGVLLSPESFSALREAAAAGDRLRAALPLLLGAARSGVAVPSATVETLGLGLADDWRALNELLAAIPLTITHGEDGERLPAAHAPLTARPVSEDDEELVLSS